jgi:glyoxylase-like metal-dependent hydrolase (beta-lactamase superfamily II)
VSAPAYEVIAVRYATRETTKSECYYRYWSYGEPDAPIRMDYFFWALRAGEDTILVDTGFTPGVGIRRGRTCLHEPLEALRRLGIRPESVPLIVFTHLHYDHTGNLGAFPQAELIVQDRELEFWSGPEASRHQFALHVEPEEIGQIVDARREGRVRVLQGTEEIAPGISAICVGGHSPGQTSLVVDGVNGTVVLASDAVHYYEELELGRPFDVLVNLRAMYLAYDTLNEVVRESGGALVAGHDPLVLDRFPALDGAEGLAVRVA